MALALTQQEEIYGDTTWTLYGDNYVAISLEKERVIFKCTNKKCKHVWAREYRKCISQLASQNIIYRGGIAVRIERNPEQSELIRFENGKRVNLKHDATCPECGACGEGNKVIGYHSEKKCDARCQSATGHKCECSCGGKNHGAAHL